MKVKRLFAVIYVITVVSSGILGCGPKNTETKAEPVLNDEAVSDETVKITVQSAEDELQKNEEIREILAYIKGIKGSEISLDEVEWVQVPSDRAEELKITDEDAPDGFFIYNSVIVPDVYVLSDKCRITATDIRKDSGDLSEMTPDDFAKMFNEYSDTMEEMVFQVRIENSEIVEIAQPYTP